MDLGGLLRLAHALAGVGFVAGLVGFWIATELACRADTLLTMRLLVGVSRPFGRLITASGIAGDLQAVLMAT